MTITKVAITWVLGGLAIFSIAVFAFFDEWAAREYRSGISSAYTFSHRFLDWWRDHPRAVMLGLGLVLVIIGVLIGHLTMLGRGPAGYEPRWQDKELALLVLLPSCLAVGMMVGAWIWPQIFN